MFFVFRLDELEDTLQPSLHLFQDWLASSGNTKLSIEMLCACLEDIKRHDVVEIIQESEGKLGGNNFH